MAELVVPGRLRVARAGVTCRARRPHRQARPRKTRDSRGGITARGASAGHPSQQPLCEPTTRGLPPAHRRTGLKQSTVSHNLTEPEEASDGEMRTPTSRKERQLA
jgi:hypothetical protein